MVLDLTTSMSALAKKIAEASADGATSPVELQSMRDDAGRHFASLPRVAAHRAATDLSDGVQQFQVSAEEMVQAMQCAARAVRRLKFAEADRQSLKSAVEYQLAYVIAGYRSSIERL